MNVLESTKRHTVQSTLTVRGSPQRLPAGVVGQVEGIALVYDVVDSHGTTFSRGAISIAERERVRAGKVRLFLDHGDSPRIGMYDTHLHIGVVRDLVDEQGPTGKWQTRFRSDLFDTASGREAHEYLKAVAVTGAETGVSIGMMREPVMSRCTVDGIAARRIADCGPLGEISITAMSSVPGTRVTAVRGRSAFVSMAERLAWARELRERFDRLDGVLQAPNVTTPTLAENWRHAGAILSGAHWRTWNRINQHMGGLSMMALSREDKAFVRGCWVTGGRHLVDSEWRR